METNSHKKLLSDIEEFVKKTMSNNDASHDWNHIKRVRKMALYLADKENLSKAESEIVEYAALMHDVDDWKYSQMPTKYVSNNVVKNIYKNRPEKTSKVKNFLLTHPNCSDEKMVKILHVIKNVGFRDELRGKTIVTPEIACVQDADRLDAIGAIGVARACIFGAARGRDFLTNGENYDIANHPKMNITFEEYNKKCDTPTLNHFYDKLIFIKDLMKTKTGRKIAEKRHNFMLAYLSEINDELFFDDSR